MRIAATIMAALAWAAATSAIAQGPEQIDQVEPGRGEWQAEYSGTFGAGGEREHSVEAMFGLTDRLAVGVELEAAYSDGDIAFDTFGVKALYRLTGDDAPVALGVQVQFAFDDRAGLAEAEARLIAAIERGGWWAQGNVMLRRSNEDGEAAARPAYAWSLQYELGEAVWVGIEGSGQLAPLWADAGAGADEGHFAGPSLTFERRPAAGAEIEIGLAWFRRIGGGGPRDSGRVFVQASF